MNGDLRYQNLDADKISGTIERLADRIGARFPDSGLRQICLRLLDVSQHAKERAAWIDKPQTALRFATAALIALILLALIGSFFLLSKPTANDFTFFQFIQVLESAINDCVLLGAAIFFLMTTETRIKRGRALKALHELRAIAHIIDMHQLTKDPDQFLWPEQFADAPTNSNLTPFELGRYLDYCSEMLSLVSKIAALYIQNFDDPVALAAVNEIETMTASLSGKIWQKLVILNTLQNR